MSEYHVFDVGQEDLNRRSLVIEAMGDEFDPAEILQDEQEADELLFSNLDAEQQETYDMLVREGVICARSRG